MTTSDEFDWSDDPAIVLQDQPPIAVYTNESGAIVLRMGGDVIQNYNQIIIRPENALAIVGAILRAADMGDVELSSKLFDMPYGAGYEDVELPPAREALASDVGASASVTQAEAEKPKAAPLSNAERQRRFKEKHRAGNEIGNGGNDGGNETGNGNGGDDLPLGAANG